MGGGHAGSVLPGVTVTGNRAAVHFHRDADHLNYLWASDPKLYAGAAEPGDQPANPCGQNLPQSGELPGLIFIHACQV